MADKGIKIETVALSAMKPAPYNPRTITDGALAGLRESIKKFGCVEPIIYNERTRNVVGGHQRLKVLELEGVTETQVVVVDLSAAEEKMLNVALNNPHIQGEFSAGIDELLAELRVEDPDMFEALMLEDLADEYIIDEPSEVTEDEIPDTAPARVKRGELWALGEHRLLCGDCASDVPRLMDGAKAPLMLTDPPYAIGVEYGEGCTDTKQYLRDLIPSIMSIYTNHATRALITCGTANIHEYPPPRWTLAWVVPAGTGMGPWGFSCWHPILAYGADPFLEAGIGSRPDIIEQTEASPDVNHPCPKPLRVWAKVIQRGSINKADIILDPFLGSGTTLIACEQLGRICYGIEIEPKYCDVAIERWESLTGKTAELLEAAPNG